MFSLVASTLPLGAIILLGNKFDQQIGIGCINNLYKSVQDLNSDVFWNNICQEMLLWPCNPLEDYCQRVKVKVDDTQPTKYFMCHSCSKGTDLVLSTFKGGRCTCGKLMKKEMELLVESKEEPAGGNGVFVKGDAMFLILDDLRVIKSSPSDSVQPLHKHRHKVFTKMEIIPQNVGTKEIISILKQALTSKTPLSDVFLQNRKCKPKNSFSSHTGPIHWEGSAEIKVILRKLRNKIMFAEADRDFVDFLVSFLTTPLGSILNLMNDKLSLGSIGNLYTSVKNLDPSWFIGSSKKSLLSPRVASQFGCKSNALNALQEDTPKYWYGTVEAKDNINTGRIMISKRKDMIRDPTEMKLFEPRCCDGARESAVGFMKRPCLFVVMDDLEVITVRTSSSISYLQQPNVKLNHWDQEHMVEIRKSHEALNMLMASLTSETAFTRSLYSLLWKWQFQRCIPFWGGLEREKKRQIKKKEKKEKERGKVERRCIACLCSRPVKEDLP